MPLGLMSGMQYEEKEASLAPGDHVLFYSDGLVEAHNPDREMFGFPRLKDLVRDRAGGDALIGRLLGELDRFTGAGWEQEDDVTLVTLQRTAGAPPVPSREGRDMTGQEAGVAARADGPPRPGPRPAPLPEGAGQGGARRLLAEFSLPSEPGSERLAMERVAEAVLGLGLPERRLKRLKTAVAEAAMNAIEHGNRNRPELPVDIRVLASDTDLSVQITDQGEGQPIPEPETPDLEAKLAGLQRARGWGLFLIKNMVDELDVTSDGAHHTIALTLHLKGDADGSHPL
jgi:anti-sigma regulatory factor (Ser/Thr protein kinase)